MFISISNSKAKKRDLISTRPSKKQFKSLEFTPKVHGFQPDSSRKPLASSQLPTLGKEATSLL